MSLVLIVAIGAQNAYRAAPGPAPRARGRGGAVLRGRRRGADRRRRGRHGAGAGRAADAGHARWRGWARPFSRAYGLQALWRARRPAALQAAAQGGVRCRARPCWRRRPASRCSTRTSTSTRCCWWAARARSTPALRKLLVRGRRRAGQRAVVRRAGLRRAPAGAGVRAAARLAGARRAASAAPCCVLAALLAQRALAGL